ncbi:MAG: hypothetical protein ACP5KA_00875 [Desulfurococcaceae archaeon]
MQRRPLVIAIYDPQWFIRVLELLKKRRVNFHHYYTPSEVPPGSVVYTDYKPIVDELVHRSDLLVLYDEEKSCRSLEKAIMLVYMREKYNSISIGVDPGSTISYAVVGDGDLLFYGEGSLEELDRGIEYVLKCMYFDEISIKVGAGHLSGDIIVHLKRKFSAPLQLVDESATSPSASRINEVKYISKRLGGLKSFRHKGVYSAYRIALSEGVEVL